MILTAPFANLNILSYATAQGYNNNENYYEDRKYSKYPTDDKKYECRTGPFEGFFVSSVEFCKFKLDDKRDNRDNRTGIQGPPGAEGPPGLQGSPGASGANGTNGINGTNGVNGTEIDPCVACLLDALVKLDSGAILVNVTAEIEFSGDRVEIITLPLIIDVDVALLLQQQLANATGLDPDATIFEICAALDEQGLDVDAVLDGLEITLVPIVEEQITKLVLTIVAAINNLLGTSIVLTPEEVIDAVDIDAIIAQITANVEISLDIFETCLGQVPPPVPVNNLCTVWQDDTPGNNEIFFSGSHDDGQTFSTPLNISTNTVELIDHSIDPQTKCEGNNVYVVWRESDSTPAAEDEIFFSFSHDGGQTFSQPGNLSNNTGFSTKPQISSVGNNVYVVWEDDNNNIPGDRDIFFARSTDGGQTFSEPENISENSGVSVEPQVSSVGNNVYVVWVVVTASGNLDIFFARSTDGGQTFSEPDNLSEENTGDSFVPQISSEGNNVYVVWAEATASGNFDIFFSFSNDGGQTFSDPNNISEENVGFSFNPQISSEGNNVYVVWEDETDSTLGNREIFFSFSHDGGQTFSEPDNLSEENTESSFEQQISSEGNNVYVVWREDIPIPVNDDDIFFSFSHDGGQTFSEPENISENSGVSFRPQISSEINNVYVIWEDSTPGDDDDIFFARSTNGGQTFSFTPDNISNNTGNSADPQISSTIF